MVVWSHILPHMKTKHWVLSSILVYTSRGGPTWNKRYQEYFMLIALLKTTSKPISGDIFDYFLFPGNVGRLFRVDHVTKSSTDHVYRSLTIGIELDWLHRWIKHKKVFRSAHRFLLKISSLYKPYGSCVTCRPPSAYTSYHRLLTARIYLSNISLGVDCSL